MKCNPQLRFKTNSKLKFLYNFKEMNECYRKETSLVDRKMLHFLNKHLLGCFTFGPKLTAEAET